MDEVTPDDKLPVDSLQPVSDSAELSEPLVEPEVLPTPDSRVHPLQPGGKRFEQIYAQGKQAQRDLDSERERRIAAEAKLDLLTSKPSSPATDTEYSWAQLEEFIQQGRITRADAQAHREEVLTRRLSTKLKGDFTAETSQAKRTEALTRGIYDYVAAVPAIAQAGSADRVRIDEEFDWLASVQGVDSTKMSTSERKALELTALRNVYGPLDSLVKRNLPAASETHQGLPGGTPPRRTANPDQALLDGLTKGQVEHYNKMFRAGRYPGGWKEVVAELKYVPARVRR